MSVQTSSASEMSWPAARSRPARILVLEGSERFRSQMVGELVVGGWEVLHASSPADALIAWVGSRQRIDLLIVDPFTTGDAGLRLCRLLRSVQADLGLLLWASGPSEVSAEDPTVTAVEAAGLLTREVRRLLAADAATARRGAPPVLCPRARRTVATALTDRWPRLQLRALWALVRQLPVALRRPFGR